MSAPAFKKTSPFTQKQAAIPKAAPFVVEMAPSLWADGRKSKPAQPVQVGLRLLSEADFTRARTVAAKFAWNEHQEPADEDCRIECFNAKLMGLLMAEAACLAGNVDQKYFENADIKIFLDLTPEGIRYLWDHYEAFACMQSTTAAEAIDDELTELADALLAGDLFSGMELEKTRRIRRLLKMTIDAAN